MAISVVSFSFSRVAQPEAQEPSSLLDAGFLYCILSPMGLVYKLTDILSSPSYIIVQSPTQYLPILAIGMCHFRHPWNGMFDRHQAEITVMQFTGHSLPVLQSVSVPWDFNPVPHYQPSPPTRFLPITAIGMCHFRCLWNGMFGWVKGQYTTMPPKPCL